MADLNVQPKKQNQWWIWLLIIIIGAAVLYFFLHKNDTHTSDKIVTDTTVTK